MAKDNIEFEEGKGGAQNPVEKYEKPLTIAGVALIVIVLGYFGFTRFYLEPKQDEALANMFMAEQFFSKDSFKLALEGNSEAEIMGFDEIADVYGITAAGNLAHYYAGICNLQLGSKSKDSIKALDYYSAAVDHLKSFSSDSRMLAPLSLGACGDALCELAEYNEAVKFYNKAAIADENEYTAAMYLKKAGLVYEKLGDAEKALATYTKIKNEYGTTQIGNSIDKYISRAQTLK